MRVVRGGDPSLSGALAWLYLAGGRGLIEGAE